MKRLQLLLLLAGLCTVSAGAETTAAAGGGVTFDSSSTALVTPTLVATLAGDSSWLPTDRVGAFFDWSAAGSYDPFAAGSSALATATASTSYLSGTFLGKLSVSSVATVSTTDPFYGAVSSELLLSYGDPGASVFAAPRFTIVEDSGVSMDVGGRMGVAVLVAEKLLIKPSFEAGVSVPGGFPSGWFYTPRLALSWYSGGGWTLDLSGGYSRSSSVRLASLVTGGQLLPLDTYQRGFLSAEATWVGNRGTVLSLGLPVSYTDLTYDAYDGGVDLGVPAWLVDLQPTAQLSIHLTNALDLLFTVDGTFDFSNNTLQQTTAFSATTQLQLRID